MRLAVVLKQGLAVLQEIIQVVADDLDGDGELQGLVVATGGIDEPGYGLHATCQYLIQSAVAGQDVEDVLCIFWLAKPPMVDDVEPHVDGGFTGTLDVEYGCVLVGFVRIEARGIVFFSGSGNAAFYGYGFPGQDVIRHGVTATSLDVGFLSVEALSLSLSME